MEILLLVWMYLGLCFGIAGASYYWNEFSAAHNISTAMIMIFVGPIVATVLIFAMLIDAADDT